MKTSELQPMDYLKEKLKSILDVIPPGAQIYYIDYPVYDNGGDLLIMKGTEQFFNDYGINVRKRYCMNDFPKNLYIPEEYIIVLTGGGNFGDLYPDFQNFREKIIKSYPNNRIVILPQTIYFKDDSKYDNCAKVLNDHKNLHIFIRDEECYELAKKKLPSCMLYLSPDMAHQLWPITNSTVVSESTLHFLRKDQEVGNAQLNTSNNSMKGHYQDWGTLFSVTDRATIKVISKVFSLKGRLRLKFSVSSFWYSYSGFLLKKAYDLFGKYERIETSRLHGHILACLMDKPHVLIDNSYGKNSNYYHTWTYRCGNAQLGSQKKADGVSL